jgi:uncharacterized repeat protein (TIGR01451 family)
MKLRNRIQGLIWASAWLLGGALGAAHAQPNATPPAAPKPAAPPSLQPPAPASVPAPPPKIIIIKPAGPQTFVAPGGNNPTGRQEPAVSLEWIGPGTAKVGQPVSYQIIVKNISTAAVEDVVIKNPIPSGITVTATEPKAVTEDNVLFWKLGTLEPRQQKRLDLQMVPSATGAIACHATVTLSGSASTRLRVFEPKLTIKATGPAKVIIGDPVAITLTITNPGDATAEAVKIVTTLSDGLEHARGKTIDYDLGNLASRETRTVQLLCAAKSGGTQQCQAQVLGEPKLTATDIASVEVLVPKVELSITGPGMRYLDRHATVLFKVTNPGTATANHLALVDQVPQGFSFVSATHDGRHDFVSRTVTWQLGNLAPGQVNQVSMELIAANPGEHKNVASVTAARGLKADSELVTRVEGLPALLMELIDLDDPVEVGTQTSYEIRVTNTGTKTETNLQLTCTVPEKMECLGAKGPADLKFKQEGKEITFDPVPKLAPRADVIYRVNVKGTAPGDMRFRASIKADGLTEPVLKEESTKVYGDEASPPK